MGKLCEATSQRQRLLAELSDLANGNCRLGYPLLQQPEGGAPIIGGTSTLALRTGEPSLICAPATDSLILAANFSGKKSISNENLIFATNLIIGGGTL